MAFGEFSDLVTNLALRFKRLGFTWEALNTSSREAYFWACPPVHEPQALLGLEPRYYSPLSLSTNIDEWWDVYARYAEQLGESDPYVPARRLAYELQLPFMAQRRMTPAKDLPPRGRWYMPLAGYAMLVKGAMPEDVELIETCRSLVATHRAGHQFGVIQGLPAGVQARQPKAHKLTHKRGLSYLLAPFGIQRRTPGVFDRLRLWVEELPTEDQAGLVDALSVFFWAANQHLPLQLQELLFMSVDVELRWAVEFARGFKDFVRPRAMLRETFVPDFMPNGRFNELFGSTGGETHPVSEQTASRWAAALDSLYRS